MPFIDSLSGDFSYDNQKNKLDSNQKSDVSPEKLAEEQGALFGDDSPKVDDTSEVSLFSDTSSATAQAEEQSNPFENIFGKIEEQGYEFVVNDEGEITDSKGNVLISSSDKPKNFNGNICNVAIKDDNGKSLFTVYYSDVSKTQVAGYYIKDDEGNIHYLAYETPVNESDVYEKSPKDTISGADTESQSGTSETQTSPFADIFNSIKAEGYQFTVNDEGEITDSKGNVLISSSDKPKNFNGNICNVAIKDDNGKSLFTVYYSDVSKTQVAGYYIKDDEGNIHYLAYETPVNESDVLNQHQGSKISITYL